MTRKTLLWERIAKLEAEVKTSDEIIANYARVVDALPCALHGRCVPHALEQIAELQKQVVLLREELRQAEKLKRMEQVS